MVPMTLRALGAAAGGRLVGPDGCGDLIIDGPVVTDSRAAGPGGLYVARIGEHADGHDFAAAARAAGAVAALTSRELPDVPGLPCIVVEDVQVAFGRIARAVLDAAGANGTGPVVVGITGSSGKTSTKDLLAQVLGWAGETVAPVNSLNGEIGVPLTVCRITPSTRFLIVEMGARGIGHIRYLTEIAPPRIGVVLNVGTAHLGEFGGEDAIAQAKGELVEALPPTGVAILSADCGVVAEMATRTTARVCRVGEGEGAADVRATDVQLDPQGRPRFLVVTPVGTADVDLALHGRHQVGNALAVIAVALECGLPLGAIAESLHSAGPVSRWRMEVTERADGVTVVNDAYNANPDSMTAALAALEAMSGPADGHRRRTWAVLGEMLELGPDTAAKHDAVGVDACERGINVIVSVGQGAAPIAHAARRMASGDRSVTVYDVEDTDTAYALLAEKLRPGDVVLFKSSNAAGLRWLGDRVAGRKVST